MSSGILARKVVGRRSKGGSGARSALCLPFIERQNNFKSEVVRGGDIEVFDFSDPARRARTYESYLQRISEMPTDSLGYVALALHGPVTTVNRKRGTLAVLTLS